MEWRRCKAWRVRGVPMGPKQRRVCAMRVRCASSGRLRRYRRRSRRGDAWRGDGRFDDCLFFSSLCRWCPSLASNRYRTVCICNDSELDLTRRRTDVRRRTTNGIGSRLDSPRLASTQLNSSLAQFYFEAAVTDCPAAQLPACPPSALGPPAPPPLARPHGACARVTPSRPGCSTTRLRAPSNACQCLPCSLRTCPCPFFSV